MGVVLAGTVSAAPPDGAGLARRVATLEVSYEVFETEHSGELEEGGDGERLVATFDPRELPWVDPGAPCCLSQA